MRFSTYTESVLRVVKDYDERKQEILNVAQRLFVTKGYSKCSVNDILQEVGIAKGTFYYYFSSKEEVLDAIITQITEQVRRRLEIIVSQTYETPEQKLFAVALGMRVKSEVQEGLLDEFHKPENALFHQKSLVAMENTVLPFMVSVVEEGVKSGAFVCAYPEQYMRIFLTSALVLLDDGIFQVDEDRKQETFRAMIALLSQMLGMDDEKSWDMVTKYWK